jgi:hypothetical protein
MTSTFRARHALALLSAIFLLLTGLSSSAQVKRTITGIVKDASGNPLSGVTVREKVNKGGGNITDELGRFSVKADANVARFPC